MTNRTTRTSATARAGPIQRSERRCGRSQTLHAAMPEGFFRPHWAQDHSGSLMLMIKVWESRPSSIVGRGRRRNLLGAGLRRGDLLEAGLRRSWLGLVAVGRQCGSLGRDARRGNRGWRGTQAVNHHGRGHGSDEQQERESEAIHRAWASFPWPGLSHSIAADTVGVRRPPSFHRTESPVRRDRLALVRAKDRQQHTNEGNHEKRHYNARANPPIPPSVTSPADHACDLGMVLVAAAETAPMLIAHGTRRIQNRG